VLFADVATVDRAVAAAKRALPEWRDASLGKRAKVMFAFRELVAKHADDLARILTQEHGQGLQRRAGRGGARARGDRVRRAASRT
jgi:malonate-semialdehyde dehydrogenase (acetylating)/methylmalonate-semialdehyde dehydrogenase